MSDQNRTTTDFNLIQRTEAFMAVCLRQDITGVESNCTFWEAPLPNRKIGDNHLHIVHLAKARRAGVALVGTGALGGTFWTDAATPAEAMARYLAANNQA